MAKLVIDASLAAAWCFPDERTDYTNEVLQAVGSTIDPIAPSLWAYEIRNTVLIGVRRGRITGGSAQKLLGFLEGLKVQLVAPPSYDRIFELAERYTLTFYDAAYLDLSIREGSRLASLDDALRKAAVNAGISLYVMGT